MTPALRCRTTSIPKCATTQLGNGFAKWGSRPVSRVWRAWISCCKTCGTTKSEHWHRQPNPDEVALLSLCEELPGWRLLETVADEFGLEDAWRHLQPALSQKIEAERLAVVLSWLSENNDQWEPRKSVHDAYLRQLASLPSGRPRSPSQPTSRIRRQAMARLLRALHWRSRCRARRAAGHSAGGHPGGLGLPGGRARRAGRPVRGSLGRQVSD